MSQSLSKRDLIFCEKALMLEVYHLRHSIIEIPDNDQSTSENLKSLEQHYLDTHSKVREIIKELEAGE